MKINEGSDRKDRIYFISGLKILIFLILLTNQITLRGILLLSLTLYIVLNFVNSFLSYLVVLVYIRGVLLLLLYLTTLTSNVRSFSNMFRWGLVILPAYWWLRNSETNNFSFYLLLRFISYISFILILFFLVFILLLISFFVANQKKTLKSL